MFDKICDYCVDEAVEMIYVEETENEKINRTRLEELLENNEKKEEILSEISIAEANGVNKGFKIGMQYAIFLAVEIAINRKF